jgi:hypothetical protein
MRDLTPISLSDFERTPYRYSTMIRATPAAVFAELGDPSLWFALLYHSVWKTGATSGIGAERLVSMRGFGQFHERMLAWDAPKRVAFTMIGTTSRLVDQFGEDLRIEPLADGVRFEWRVCATPSTLGRAVPLGAIFRGLFARSARNLAKRSAWSAGQLAATHGS